MSESSKPLARLDPNRSALLIARDGSYRHNLSTICEKVGRITNLSPHQAYIFLRRFANAAGGGQNYGINAKIAAELNLHPKTSHIPNALNNVYKQSPEPESVRNMAARRDFKSSVLSKAHQAMLTLMFIKTVDPDVDLDRIKSECAKIFDHYVPDITMIANGDICVEDSKENECHDSCASDICVDSDGEGSGERCVQADDGDTRSGCIPVLR